MAIAICENCKKEFTPKRDTRGRFCSLACYHRGMVGVPHGHKTNGIAWNKGKKLPRQSGKNHFRYIEDRTKLKDDSRERGGQLHREWSQSVKNRDGWKCKISNSDCSGRVVAHHILPWRDYEELRYEVNNGITLCHFHHPRKRKDEMILSPFFQELVGVKAN